MIIISGLSVDLHTFESTKLPVVAKKKKHCAGAKKINTWLTDVPPESRMKENQVIGIRLKLVYVSQLMIHKEEFFDESF